jgi:hypothetical protein
MKNLKYIIFMLALVFSANSCQKFDELEADPNRSTTVPPSLILRGVTRDMYYGPWGDEAQYCQYFCVNYFYYGNNEYWSGAANLRYTTLKNVVKMEDEAAKIGLPAVNAYSALGKFFRAYFYYDMTMRMGDLPLSQALKGSDNIAPAYDTQKDIFKQILKWLDESNTDLAARIAVADVSLQGGGYDIYFDGDLKKWQKAVNAFKLRVLAQLSKKDADGDLNIKGEFSRIIGSPTQFPLPTGNADNMSFKYNNSTDKYPTNPDNFGFDALRNNLSATHVGTLTRLKDPRTFVTVEPASYYSDTLGYGDADFRSYVGAPYDESLDAMTTKAQGGKYSLIRRDRYYSSYNAEDCIQIGYPEMCFNIAEGIQRGWASGSAADWYAKGIAASMAFYDITDATVLGDYLAQPEVALKSGNDGITQILEQKYIALFQHSGLESYFTWRRSGVPEFTQGVGTGNSGVIPRRYQYPTSERDNNSKNYTDALKKQFGTEEDNINSKLWIEQ